MKFIFQFTLLILLNFQLIGQIPKGSDIYLGTITWKKDFPKISPLDNVTVKKGYDNQPSFSSDNQVIYYTTTQGANTDIFKYFIEQESRTFVTSTKGEDEYSALETPDHQISFVRVEKDSAQRIWKSSGQNKSALISPKLDSVGYYHWMDKDNIIAYRITKPHSLAIFNIPTQSWENLNKKPGRCFQKVGDQVFLAFSEPGDSLPFLYKTVGKNFEKITQSLTSEADFAVNPDGTLFQAKGKKVYYFHPKEKKWVDFGETVMKQISEISRLTVSPDGKYLLIVAPESTQ